MAINEKFISFLFINLKINKDDKNYSAVLDVQIKICKQTENKQETLNIILDEWIPIDLIL